MQTYEASYYLPHYLFSLYYSFTIKIHSIYINEAKTIQEQCSRIFFFKFRAYRNIYILKLKLNWSQLQKCNTKLKSKLRPNDYTIYTVVQGSKTMSYGGRCKELCVYIIVHMVMLVNFIWVKRKFRVQKHIHFKRLQWPGIRNSMANYCNNLYTIQNRHLTDLLRSARCML